MELRQWSFLSQNIYVCRYPTWESESQRKTLENQDYWLEILGQGGGITSCEILNSIL